MTNVAGKGGTETLWTMCYLTSALLYYLAHGYNAYGECNVFTLSVLPSVHMGGGGGAGLGICTIWLISKGLSTFWLRTTHPHPPGDEYFLAYQREIFNRYSNCLLVSSYFFADLSYSCILIQILPLPSKPRTRDPERPRLQPPTCAFYPASKHIDQSSDLH